VFSGKIRDNSNAVFDGIIIEILLLMLSLLLILYSLNLKLSVEANTISSSFIDKNIHAKVGLIFHSATEKRVFSMADFKILDDILKTYSCLNAGIKGNFDASIHLTLISEEDVLNNNDEFHKSSTSNLSSGNKDENEDKNLEDTVNTHSECISIHLSIIYSIAISKLFAVKTIFLY
jgi:hypothetical protein